MAQLPELFEEIRLLIQFIRLNLQSAARFDAAQKLLVAGLEHEVPDSIVLECLNLCINIQGDPEIEAAVETLRNVIQFMAAKKESLFRQLPKFFDIAVNDQIATVTRGFVCLKAIACCQQILYPLRVEFTGFMKKTLEKFCQSMGSCRSVVAINMFKVAVNWQIRKNLEERDFIEKKLAEDKEKLEKEKGNEMEVDDNFEEEEEEEEKREDKEDRVVNEEKDKEDRDLNEEKDKTITLRPIKIEKTSTSSVTSLNSEPEPGVIVEVDEFGEPIQKPFEEDEEEDEIEVKPSPEEEERRRMFPDIPTEYFEQLISLLVRVAATFEDRKLLLQYYELINASLTSNFCRGEVKVMDVWFDHLFDAAKQQNSARDTSELYYTLFFFHELLELTKSNEIVLKVLAALEKPLVNILEQKLVAVYPTAFALITRFFYHNDPHAFGLVGAPNLSQHMMRFFRDFFTKVGDPQTTFDDRFCVQLRIITNFLASVSKYQASIAESINLGFFIKASQRVASCFSQCLLNNINDDKIYLNHEYINLLKSVICIVRVVAPSLHNASQEIRRSLAQSIFIRAIPVSLPSHLVDVDLIRHLMLALLCLLSGPAAPSYCVPMLQKLLYFRHLILKHPSLRPYMTRISKLITTTDSLKNTQLQIDLEPVLIVENMKLCVKKAKTHFKDIKNLEDRGINSITSDLIRIHKLELNKLMRTWFNYQIPVTIQPHNLYEMPTLMALRAKAMGMMTEISTEKRNEFFLLAINLVEECRKQPTVILQRVREEERIVFKYYSEFLEQNLNSSIQGIRKGAMSWRVDDVLDACNCLLVTSRALRFANETQGQKLVKRFLRIFSILSEAKAATTCEIAKWSDYISIALDEVPLDHWAPHINYLISELDKGLLGADFIHRIIWSFKKNQSKNGALQ